MGEREASWAPRTVAEAPVNGEDVFWRTLKTVVRIVREGALGRPGQIFIGADLSNRVTYLPAADGAAVIKTGEKFNKEKSETWQTKYFVQTL